MAISRARGSKGQCALRSVRDSACHGMASGESAADQTVFGRRILRISLPFPRILPSGREARVLVGRAETTLQIGACCVALGHVTALA
jgi:hypothetical protein